VAPSSFMTEVPLDGKLGFAQGTSKPFVFDQIAFAAGGTSTEDCEERECRRALQTGAIERSLDAPPTVFTRTVARRVVRDFDNITAGAELDLACREDRAPVRTCNMLRSSGRHYEPALEIHDVGRPAALAGSWVSDVTQPSKQCLARKDRHTRRSPESSHTHLYGADVFELLLSARHYRKTSSSSKCLGQIDFSTSCNGEPEKSFSEGTHFPCNQSISVTSPCHRGSVG
jgi:hypothetical protein